jgi:hypothetical protein
VRIRRAPALFVALLLVFSGTATAQVTPKKPRRQFVSVSFDAFRTQPLHFAKWPVEELVGREVSEAQPLEPFDYRSRDGLTTVDVLEFKKAGQGYGVTVYPLGMASGPALGLRLSREDLPVIRMAIAGPAKVPSYTLMDAYAVDFAAQLVIADRSPGWGLGSHAFVGGGLGKVRSSLSDGKRYFAEGGGGLTIGPLGFEVAVKFAYNSLDEPLQHHFMTVPVALRTSVTF